MSEPPIIEGAEAFELGEGSSAVLLIHGFTSSPQALRGLGEHLASRGLAVIAPRLAGHGTTWQDLNDKGAADWRHGVQLAYDEAIGGRDEVFMVGLSFGAALALDFVERHPGRVAGLVTLAGMVHSNDPRRVLAPIISHLVPSVSGVGNDIAEAGRHEIAYDRLPTLATRRMLRLLREVRGGLDYVRCPVLIMHSRNDHTVHPGNAQMIYDRVSSGDREITWLERPYHVLTLDYHRAKVFAATFEFIKEHSRHAF